MENYTNRCLMAILSLEKKYVNWPNASTQALLKSCMSVNSIFGDCVGFLDGTIIPLANAPVVHKEDYWMHKMVYGVNSLIVCDINGRVIFGYHGWCGSAHDQRVYKATKVSV